MQSIRLAKPDDRECWDNYVLNHQDGTPYHLFAWQEAVTGAYRHQPCYLLAESGNTLVGILPLILMKIPLKGQKVVSLPFCDLGGPLADSAEISSALTKFAETKFAANEIELRENANEICLDNSSLAGQKVRMILPLPENSKQLMKGFKSKLRSQINKAKKNNLHYVLAHPSENQDMVDAFYHVFSINMRALGSPVHSKKWFEMLCGQYGKHCMMSIAYLDDIPVAGGIVLLSGNKASIPWASTIPEYNRLSPNMLLYWSLLEYCSDHQIGEFDFGRSTFGEGTYNFKAQWGALPRLLHWHSVDKTSSPDLMQVSFPRLGLRKIVETVWRRLPLGMTVVIGPLIRRYISL